MSSTPTPANKPAQHATEQGVTARAVILGCLLIPVNCYWMAIMEMQWNSLDSTCVSLFFHVVFMLLVLMGVNQLVASKWPRLALRRAELMTLYIMLSLASAVMGRDMLENLPSVLGFMWWFEDPAARYNRFMSFVPKWMAPQDKALLKGYYVGNSSIWKPEHFQMWLGPVLFWTCFMMALVFVMLCINVLLRKHWSEHEKLAYPIVQIPLAITEPTTYRKKAVWFGAAIPFIIQSINNLNYFFPSIPSMHLKLQDIGPLFAATPPWNGLGWFPIAFFPFAIGFAFFLPQDLAFSCWFFYILRKAIDVGCTAWGLRDANTPASMALIPYVHEQGTGAWVGLSIALIWLSRHYLKGVLIAAWKGKGADDPAAGMSYRMAVLGLLAGCGALYAMCLAAGMSAWLPLIYFAFYFVLSVGITRVRAELGPPAHELNWVNPERVIVNLLGTEALGARNLTLLTFMYWFNRGYRSHPMPHQLEAMKVGKDLHMEGNRLAAVSVLAALMGTFIGFWCLLDVMYRKGEGTAHIMSYATGIGREAFGRLSDWSDNPRKPQSWCIGFYGVGAMVTLLLAVAKTRILWWPFHPIGYALANSYAMEYFWSSLFIGWLIKTLVVRYGGVRLYRGAQPFFLGVILGDYTVAAVWSLIGWALGVSTYRTFIF